MNSQIQNRCLTMVINPRFPRVWDRGEDEQLSQANNYWNSKKSFTAKNTYHSVKGRILPETFVLAKFRSRSGSRTAGLNGKGPKAPSTCTPLTQTTSTIEWSCLFPCFHIILPRHHSNMINSFFLTSFFFCQTTNDIFLVSYSIIFLFIILHPQRNCYMTPDFLHSMKRSYYYIF